MSAEQISPSVSPVERDQLLPDASQQQNEQPRSGAPSVAFDKSLDDQLKLNSYDLTLEEDHIVVTDRVERRKKSRGCLPGNAANARRKIPLYNVLWASLSEDTRSLTISYAEQISKTRLEPVNLIVPVPRNPDVPPEAIPTWISALLTRAYASAIPKKRAYVLVNPHAGPGGASKKWEKEVKPIFDAAQMECTVVTTTCSGEAIKLCEELDVDKYDIIAACSGDGLPYEVFNGLGRRQDARTALAKIAVCHVPCGSGNALACNICGTHRPSLAALAIVKGVSTPLDLISITQGDRRTLSFLSQSLGMAAEVDLGTEHMRWMGETRFTVGVLQRIWHKKTFPCDLAVKIEVRDKNDIVQHYSRFRGRVTGETLSNAATAVNGNHDREGEEDQSEQGLPSLKYGTVNDKIPEDWELMPQEKMGNFFCGNMGFMSPDMNFFPAALINDGLLDMFIVDGDLPATKAISVFTSVDSGQFFENPHVRYHKVAAYRITPKNQTDGYISVDGERMPFEPFQAEVHRGLGRVLTRQGRYEAPGPKNWDKVTPTERIMA